jgi:hypothetical protein
MSSPGAGTSRYARDLNGRQMDSYSNLLIADMRLQELSGRSGLYLECGEDTAGFYCGAMKSADKDRKRCAWDAMHTGISDIPAVQKIMVGAGMSLGEKIKEAEYRNPTKPQRRIIEIIARNDLELARLEVTEEGRESAHEKASALKTIKRGLEVAAHKGMGEWEVIKYIAGKYGIDRDYNRLHHSLIAEISGN